MSLRQLFTEIEQDEWVNIPQGWLQGRTIYGGLVAGMMMQKALVTIADPAKRLLSTSVTFVGPVQESKARLTAEILRQGKSVTTIEVRLWQDDAVQSILLPVLVRNVNRAFRYNKNVLRQIIPSLNVWRSFHNVPRCHSVISNLMCVGLKVIILVPPVQNLTLVAGSVLIQRSMKMMN